MLDTAAADFNAANASPPTTSMKLLGSGASFRHELLALLENIELIEGLSWRETEQLGTFLQAFEAEPGCVVFREGDPGGYLCLLLPITLCLFVMYLTKPIIFRLPPQ